MADHDGIVPGCPSEDTRVTDVVLDVADDGTLRDPAEWYDVAVGERGTVAAVVFRVEVVSKYNRLSCGEAPV